MDVALVHVHDDCSAVFLLLQRSCILVDVAVNERVAVRTGLVDKMFHAVDVAKGMQPAMHSTLGNNDVELLLQFMAQCGARFKSILQRHGMKLAMNEQLRGKRRTGVARVERVQRIGTADGSARLCESTRRSKLLLH